METDKDSCLGDLGIHHFQQDNPDADHLTRYDQVYLKAGQPFVKMDVSVFF